MCNDINETGPSLVIFLRVLRGAFLFCRVYLVQFINDYFVTGFCSHLRLVAGQDSRVVETFSRTGPQDNGTNVEYQSQSNDASVFYLPELGAWAIGGYQLQCFSFRTLNQIDF